MVGFEVTEGLVLVSHKGTPSCESQCSEPNDLRNPFYLGVLYQFWVICLYMGGIVREIRMIVKVRTTKRGNSVWLGFD